ncbi:G-protein beta WD-40 repeats containing protein [Reticulomyxa filosa]|uniref:G-protein beta WD-40 repeats containing protein n=1 Tax=Reticulomyxa filosa TaxID=46433 RepID=X6ML19_RETFI|nr:G-protein beta WD-40 repeats containing protein [Reticulomyxa filosa]|eukprot:ETO14549.1 G-protein beta WD-40 repeats containing protein [Reticulomyxa filosa]
MEIFLHSFKREKKICSTTCTFFFQILISIENGIRFEVVSAFALCFFQKKPTTKTQRVASGKQPAIKRRQQKTLKIKRDIQQNKKYICNCRERNVCIFDFKKKVVIEKLIPLQENGGLSGGMQSRTEQKKYAKEIKVLMRLCGDIIEESEVQKQLEESNGNVSLVLEKILSELLNQNVKQEKEIIEEVEILRKEEESEKVGEIKPGINLQGYCDNEKCLASKGRLLVWINVGFTEIAFVADKVRFECPDCRNKTVTSIVKAMFYNSDHLICASGDSKPVEANNYQCTYTIASGLSYELKAKKIRQLATSIEDLRDRSERAMNSNEITNLVIELQKYDITVVKPPSLKGNDRLLEKIQADYNGDFNQMFDIGRFTILCDNPNKLQAAVAVIKKADQFNLIVSEDKDFFNKPSKTHHRYHNIKVYVEMQATLKHFSTLEGYTVIENPKLSHQFYEYIRAWKPNNSSKEEELKQAGDETLMRINDIICEWIEIKEIKKISNRMSENEIHSQNDISLKLSHFVYDQLCNFNPTQIKGQAIYVILFEYFKKYIMGEMNPASCADVISILKESRKQELEEDTAMLQALETYIPLQANNYQYVDNDDNKEKISYDCHQHVIDLLLEKKEEKEEKKNEQQKQQVIILQGKSGSGKSLFCRHLEETLWESYVNGSSIFVPIYISLPKYYNELNEKQIISQALQMKQINKEIIDIICENISFIFILDGFDEIFNKYNNNNNNSNNENYFYNRFNLSKWNAKIIVSCRNNVLSDEDIKQILISSNNVITTTSMIYLWPFSKEQMNGYIDKFVKMNNKNKINDNSGWTIQQYEDTLQNYPNLNKMMEEPFLLRMILTVLPSLMKRHSIGTKISKAQVYEAFNEQWIDIHVKDISNKLAELRMQTNFKKTKATFQQYCQSLAFEMFIRGSQVATENGEINYDNDKMLGNLDPITEIEIKHDDEKLGVTMKHFWEKYFNSSNETMNISRRNEHDKHQSNNENMETKRNGISFIESAQDIWKKYFNGDSVAKYVLRRVSDNKYQFLHKSCQEYYASQKIIVDILSWKPNAIANMNDQQFQQQFETHAHNLSINYKLLNEEMGIIQFIADRIHDNQHMYINLKSRLFRLIQSSKNNSKVSIAAANAATILNAARVSMSYQNWDKINISHAILDHAFLEGTSFKEAILDKVNFFTACLNYTDFTNASIKQINFGEYGYLKGHSGPVTCVQFSPDGSKIVSCSWDKTIQLWDVSSGKQLQCLEGHSDSIFSVQFSPDGTKIVSSSFDKTIRLWDASSGKHLRTLEGHSNSIVSVQFSPSGDRIASGSWDKTIRLWDVSSGKQLQCLEGHLYYVTCVQFSPDGTKVVSGSYDKTVRLWDISSGEQIQCLEGHSGSVNSVHFSPDGTTIVSGSFDNVIQLWDASSGKQLQTLKGNTGAVTSVQFSSDGIRIISGSSDNIIRLWDVSSGKQLQSLEGHTGSVNSVQFSADGSKIMSCSDDKTIRLWDASSGKQLHYVEGHTLSVNSVQFSFDGTKVISCSSDNTIQIWDAASGKQLQILEGHSNSVTSAQFSRNGTKIVSGSWDKTIRTWDTLSGKQLQSLKGHSGSVYSVQLSPDGTKIVSSSFDKTIRLWNESSGKQIHSLKGHSNSVTSAQFSPDGTKIISCSWDKTVRLWDVASRKQLQTLKGHSGSVNSVQFSPDGATIISGSFDKTIRIWDVSSGKQLQCLEGHLASVNSVHFSSDGSKIVSGSYDKTIRLWDASSGKQLQCLEGHSAPVNFVRFSPDSSRIISGSLDNTIRLWGPSSAFITNISGSSTLTNLPIGDEQSIPISQDGTSVLWRCIWQGGVRNTGLSLKNSIWKGTRGLTSLQMSVVEQYGGTF